MNNLNRSPDFPQFRCLPLVGRKASFRYVANVPSQARTVTHDEIERAVGEHLQKVRESGG